MGKSGVESKAQRVLCFGREVPCQFLESQVARRLVTEHVRKAGRLFSSEKTVGEGWTGAGLGRFLRFWGTGRVTLHLHGVFSLMRSTGSFH